MGNLGESSMNKQTTKTALFCAALLFLLPVSSFISTFLTDEMENTQCDRQHARLHYRATTRKHWRTRDDSIESRMSRLEPKVQALRESPTKRKAQNMVTEVHKLLDELRENPGKAYHITIELAELLGEI